MYGDDWSQIAASLGGQFTEEQCQRRWQKISNTKPHVKGPWTPEEDELLKSLVAKLGTKHWSLIAQHLPRTGKQCRERWCNYLDPS